MAMVRRGVHMIATARKRASWRDDPADAADEEEKEASRKQWESLGHEVEQERKKRRLAEELADGKRNTLPPVYDDVAGKVADEEAIEAQRRADVSREREAEAKAVAEQAGVMDKAEVRNRGFGSEQDPAAESYGVVTAGLDARGKKRAGQKPGSKKKRQKEISDLKEAAAKKKEEEPDRWLKLKLIGDEKPKRIDATRVVHYHDYDNMPVAQSDGAAASEDNDAAALAATAAKVARAKLRSLWEDDDDDDM